MIVKGLLIDGDHIWSADNMEALGRYYCRFAFWEAVSFVSIAVLRRLKRETKTDRLWLEKHWIVPSCKLRTCLLGKPMISMTVFNSYVSHYQRVIQTNKYDKAFRLGEQRRVWGIHIPHIFPIYSPYIPHIFIYIPHIFPIQWGTIWSDLEFPSHLTAKILR